MYQHGHPNFEHFEHAHQLGHRLEVQGQLGQLEEQESRREKQAATLRLPSESKVLDQKDVRQERYSRMQLNWLKGERRKSSNLDLYFINQNKSQLPNDRVSLVKLGMVKDKAITNFRRQISAITNSMVSSKQGRDSLLLPDSVNAKIRLQENGRKLNQEKIKQEIQFREIDNLSKYFIILTQEIKMSEMRLKSDNFNYSNQSNLQIKEKIESMKQQIKSLRNQTLQIDYQRNLKLDLHHRARIDRQICVFLLGMARDSNNKGVRRQGKRLLQLIKNL